LAARASGNRAVLDLDRELANRTRLYLVDDRPSLFGTEIEEIGWIRGGLGELLSFWFKLDIAWHLLFSSLLLSGVLGRGTPRFNA
jgi:hypothetical protein